MTAGASRLFFLLLGGLDFSNPIWHDCLLLSIVLGQMFHRLAERIVTQMLSVP
jgi:hypothetical protein